MIAKEIVRKLYDADFAQDSVMELFHPECQIHWHSSKGYRHLNYKDIEAVINDIKQSYHSFKYRISHQLQDGNLVTSRYSVYGTLIERPEEDEAIAYFISIWEVKDDKLFKCYEISQLADSSSESLNSFAEIKI